MRKFILVLALILAAVISLASCDVISELPFLSGSAGTVPDENKQSAGEENGTLDVSSEFETMRVEMYDFIDDTEAGIKSNFNYMILSDALKGVVDSEINSAKAMADSVLTVADILSVRETINNIYFRVDSNTAERVYIDGGYDSRILCGNTVEAELKRLLCEKTLIVELKYFGTERFTIDENYYNIIGLTDVQLSDYSIYVGYPVPFDEGALAYGIYVDFYGVPKLTGNESTVLLTIADANPYGWQTIKVYDNIYGEIDGAKFGNVIASEDRFVFVYNSREIYFTLNSANDTLTFERPSNEHMMTLTYSENGTRYVFNVYGVRASHYNYKTTVDITYSDGREETITCWCYLQGVSDYEETFSVPDLDLAPMAYGDDGVLFKID